ncbi:MAG: CBS domain-containing protein [Candidatus Altiarchaeota archaeon]|nr:CBS domain-containing protein [Candidatus Altiarchaeota archaeon]
METGIKVGDVMGKGVITAGPDDTVTKVCETMARYDLSGITIMERGKVVGVFTQGDLVNLVASGENPGVVKVKEIMGKEVVNIGPDSDISEAAKLMVKKKVKRLPVLRDGHLVGILTQTDIVRISPSVYDLIYEKAKTEEGPLLESETGMTGECEECGNHSETLRNVNGTLVCEECYEDIEEKL